MKEKQKMEFAKVSVCRNQLKYFKEVLDCGWLTTSSKAFQFEKRCAEVVRAKYAYMISSGTYPLIILLRCVMPLRLISDIIIFPILY